VSRRLMTERIASFSDSWVTTFAFKNRIHNGCHRCGGKCNSENADDLGFHGSEDTMALKADLTRVASIVSTC
jgi:hypothetical protein